MKLQAENAFPGKKYQQMLRASGRRLRDLRNDRRLRQDEFIARLGLTGDLTTGALGRWETGQAKRLNTDLLMAVLGWAAAEGVSVEWLLLGRGPTEAAAGRNAEEVSRGLLAEELAGALDRAVERFRGEAASVGPSLHEHAGRILAACRHRPGFQLVGPESLPPDWDRHYVPVINRVAAGAGFDLAESESGPPGWANEYVACADPPAAAIAVRVVGESMAPRFASGDILIVDPAVAAQPGRPAVVIYNDDDQWGARAVVKVYDPGKRNVRLASLNPAAAPDIVVRRADVVRALAIWKHLPALVEGRG